MDVDRKEYPGMLESLQPAQAVGVINDRIKQVNRVNLDIADWLQERRKVEEQYVQGLQKLAHRFTGEEILADMGVFSTPWQKINSSTKALAESHRIFAQSVESDVERPLRDYQGSNRELQSMPNIIGNLTAMSKEIDAAQKKTDRLKEKGSRAAASKVANASAELESATLQWDSQAPFVFEQLQAVDEGRLNHLRDLLTQYQTHEVDQVQRSKTAAEDCLNVILNVQTADEIRTFAARSITGRPRIERQRSRQALSASTTSASNTVASSMLAPPATPPHHGDDGSSQKSGSASKTQEPRSGALSALKRVGTKFGRRRHSVHPYGTARGSSPERKSASNLGFGSGAKQNKSKDPAERGSSAAEQRTSMAASAATATPRPSDADGGSGAAQSPKQTRKSADDGKADGPAVGLGAGAGEQSGSLVNGTKAPVIPSLQEPLQPISFSAPVAEPQKDAEGFSVPPSATDAITQAQLEADETREAPQQQFKVDIRNAPILEEGADAETAMANVANTLRAQAVPTRKPGTVRGRRDVRNTIFMPNPPDFTSPDASLSQLPPAAAPTAPTLSPPTQLTPQQTPQPFKPTGPRGSILAEDHAASSDTQSVRSGRSLSSSASATVRHPDLHGPGLNSSVIETASAWFEQGAVVKAMVIGQVGLAFNPTDLSAPFGTDTIRLENFAALEKVAPNPAFLENAPDRPPGTYALDLSKVTSRTAVAFHYQVHLDAANLAAFAPLHLSVAWRAEPTQTSAIVKYALNPAFALGPSTNTSVTLSNVVIVLRLDTTASMSASAVTTASTGTATSGVTGRPTTCQSKPVGTFSRDKALIYWRLGTLTLAPGAPAQQLRARFITDGEARPGTCEARWEIAPGDAAGFGSGLGVSRRVEGLPPLSAGVATVPSGAGKEGEVEVGGGGAERTAQTAPEREKEKEKDPFADEDEDSAPPTAAAAAAAKEKDGTSAAATVEAGDTAAAGGVSVSEGVPGAAREAAPRAENWTEVLCVRKIGSGTYQAAS